MAVVPVVLFHSGMTILGGGFVGVDIFFVISGYLITSILIDELDKSRFSISGFYERRARRILPALFVMVAMTIPPALAWMPEEKLSEYGQSIIGVALFVSNFVFWDQGGYFSTASDEKPLLHTWSLAVEEQYYVIFPILLALLWGRLDRRRIVQILVLVALGSFALAQYVGMRNPTMGFYLTPMRIWELLVGALCAFAGNQFRKHGWLADIGLAAIVISIFTFSKTTPPAFLLIPVLGSALIILSGSGGVATRLLSTRPMVALGLISYSTYLWHQPLFSFARLRSIDHPTPWVMAGLTLLSFILGWLSWRFVEQPFRQRRGQKAIPARVIFSGGAAGLIAAGLVGTGIVAQTPLTPHEASHARCNYGRPSCFELEQPRIRVVLWGDSHADAFMFSLGEQLQQRNAELIPLIRYACPPFLGREPGMGEEWFGTACMTHNRQAAQAIADIKPDFVVITSSMYGYYYGSRGKDLAPKEGDLLRQAFVAGAIAESASHALSSGAKVIYLLPHPVNISFERDRKLVRFGHLAGLSADRNTMDEILPMMRGALAPLLARGVSTLESGVLLCDQDQPEQHSGLSPRPDCELIDEAGLLRLYDGSHISKPQAGIVAAAIADEIEARSAMSVMANGAEEGTALP